MARMGHGELIYWQAFYQLEARDNKQAIEDAKAEARAEAERNAGKNNPSRMPKRTA